MKFLSILGIILALAILVTAEPDCHINQVMSCDQIMLDALDTLPKSTLPHTEEQIADMCLRADEAMQCGFKFRDSCMTPMQKELLQLFIEGALEGEKELCDIGSDLHKSYMQHADCLNEVSQMPEVKEELEYLLAVIEKATTLKINEGINFACCAYVQTYAAFLNMGRNKCGKEATDIVEEIIKITSAQLAEVACTGFDAEGDICKSVLPPAGSKPSGAVKSHIIDEIRRYFKHWLD